MKWEDGRRSSNVEDRRGMPGGRPAFVGGGLGMLVLVLLALFLGVDPTFLLQNVPPAGEPQQQPGPSLPADGQADPAADFISVVLADTEDTWTELFAEAGRQYEPPNLVLFNGSVQSACGFAQAAMGPFYCPADRKAYIDLSFYQELRDRFQAPGDFAQAYVLAHEVGHHVQNLLGLSARVQQAREQAGEAEANALSVRLELQADCLAGVWANRANRSRQILETGDVEEALTAASAIGDDRLQQQSRGYVTPDSFTHGSAEQRVRWFRRGLEGGQLESCDTFASRAL
ncbi:MAG: neutral zinc metallopeptidase [Gammaproteobacteria bacterium]|nr:neutral zinc metallopeptidase [Gammaproteobacteria bacterium]